MGGTDGTDGSARKPYIQVQDSGMGMAEVDVKHMFERFYRADDTRKVQGTGLGLSIAKWIVDGTTVISRYYPERIWEPG